MDTILNTISIADFTDLVRREFQAVGTRVPRVADMLYIKDERGLNNGEFALYEEYDTDTFASVKLQGENTTKARAGVGYSKTARYVVSVSKLTLLTKCVSLTSTQKYAQSLLTSLTMHQKEWSLI